MMDIERTIAMAKENPMGGELRLVAEIERLRAKLAAMESQKPVYLMRNNGDTYWAEVNKETYEDYIAAEGKDELPCDTLILYRNAVPADKPAVAIDEITNSRGEPEAIYLQLHDPDSFSEAEAADFRADGVTWCWHQINHNDVRYIRQDLTAPSHSQQSAAPDNQTCRTCDGWGNVPGPCRGSLAECPDCAARCASHESEQHNQQTEGE